VFVGLAETVRRMRAAMDRGRSNIAGANQASLKPAGQNISSQNTSGKA